MGSGNSDLPGEPSLCDYIWTCISLNLRSVNIRSGRVEMHNRYPRASPRYHGERTLQGIGFSCIERFLVEPRG